MSTVSQIESILSTLSAEDLRRVEASLRRIQNARSENVSWMELAGCLAGESEELRRIERVVEEEFEQVEPANWR